MSTRVAVIAEGPIDHALIAPLLRAVARDRAHVTWPVAPEAAADWLHMRPRGHGGVWHAVKRAVKVLSDSAAVPYAFVIILLDHRTKRIQSKVRRLISGNERFVLAVAQEEIEAWWLGDRVNTLGWLRLDLLPSNVRYAVRDYRAERDKEPKKTLDELTRLSSAVDSVYGEGHLDLATEFARHWEGKVRLSDIETQCPQRFPPFCQDTADAFKRS